MAVRLNRFVRRYTTLSSALETLGKRKLVLLSPAKWDDSNDAFLIELYRNRIQAKSVLALCCTMASETYHHWRIFTQGIEGVCLEFERVPLSRALNAITDVEAGRVDYLRIKDLQTLGDPTRLPFVKRQGYSDEREWRVVATCRDETGEFMDVPIELGWITRVVLNPWMPTSLIDNLRPIIRGLPGCSRMKIQQSHLTSSDTWKAAGRRIAEG